MENTKLILIRNNVKQKVRLIRNRLIPPYNDFILFFLGKKWETILINEYPKCGGTWLKHMLGELLLEDGYFINKKRNHLLAIKPRFIIQRHWLKHSNNVAKTILIIREPMDVYNSFYFHENYFAPNKKIQLEFGFNPEKDDKENMFNYLKYKLNYPEKTKPYFSYKHFWDTFKARKDIHVVRYEALKEDALSELQKILIFLGFSKSDKQLKNAIEACSFSKMKKKDKNTDPRKRHVRKGIVGDWKNNFNEKSVKLMEKNLKRMASEMGYEW